MKLRALRPLVGACLAASLLGFPSILRAERLPSRPIEPVMVTNDPEVPDGHRPPKAFAGRETAGADVRGTVPAATVPTAAVPASIARGRDVPGRGLLFRVTRLLVALRFGGWMR